MPDVEQKVTGRDLRFDVRQCRIHSVVVYTDRAEVKRLVPAQLPSGESEVVIEGLSASINGDSIRVEGKGAATILDVIYETTEKKTAPQEEGANGETECSEDLYKAAVVKTKELEKELEQLNFKQEVLRKQKRLLKMFATQVCNIQSEKPADMEEVIAVHAVAGIIDFMDRYEGRIADIDTRLLKLEANMRKLQDEIKVMKDRAAKTNPANKTDKETVRSVKVTLGTLKEENVELLVSYVVSNASWSPAYDLRVFTKDKSLKVHYYGLIKQSTGEDWENANVALSTAQPSIGGSAPELGMQLIQFKRRPVLRSKGGAKFGGFLSTRSSYSYYDDDSDSGDDGMYYATDLCLGGLNSLEASKPGSERMKKKERSSSIGVDVAKVATGQLYNTTYSIPRASTIPADSTEHRVTVAVIDLKPEFSYVSVPRLSPYSFLQATVLNASEYSILAGPANVFLDNNFLTKSEMSNTSPNEEFTCSLGADQAIRITCEPINSVKGTSGMLTKNNFVTMTHFFKVKNTQANPVKLKVMEQVPLSSDERLKVTLQKPLLPKPGAQESFTYGHALLNSSNNVEWHCTIPQDTAIDLTLVYTVEYPMNDTVEGLPSM